jgi:type VI secretion system secreted protein Hcp
MADMVLKVQGVTGESADAGHKGEIEVASWSWGMQASLSAAGGDAYGRSTMTELEIVKHVDQSSPTLMFFLQSNKLIKEARLTVRKAGQTPLEYLTIDLQNVRVTSLKVESQNAELLERLRLGFSKVRVSYVPQDAKGGGGAANVFEFDAHAGV